MGGFDKIEFTNNEKKSQVSDFASKPGSTERTHESSAMTNRKQKRKSKWTKIVLLAVGILVVIIGLSAIPAYATYQAGLKTYRSAKVLSAALKTQDIELASSEVGTTKANLIETQKNFKYLIPYKFVPVIGWYYTDAESLIEGGIHGLDTAQTAINAVKPYADILGLKGEGSFTGGSAEERIRTAVLAASKVTPEIDTIGESLGKMQIAIDKVDPGHYPAWLFGKEIPAQLTLLKTTVDAFGTGVNDAKPLIKALPSLLGESEDKKYLILFQNDKELRSTGGFITAYAIFRVEKGVIHIDRSDDIYVLDDTIGSKPAAPEAFQKYLKVSRLNLRDSNISPDFIESMKIFNSLYDKAGGSVEVDGIIALDTDVLVKTIKILDDQVSAGGMTFTTKEDARCDCPQVIYELENNISRPVGYVRTDRKSIIGELLNNIMTKALSSSPKIYWGPLFQTLLSEAAEKHVLFYLYDDEAQKGLEALNATGQIHDFDGDYLHINESNISGAKVNIFLQQSVENAYEIKGDEIIKTVTINYKNPYPASDCNLERGGLCLNAEYRDWIRIYVPKGSELIESEGSVGNLEATEDLGKTVFEGLMTVRPQGTATLTVKYKLPKELAGKSPLNALIQKQPGTVGSEYKIVVNGRTKEIVQLLTDKEVSIKK